MPAHKKAEAIEVVSQLLCDKIISIRFFPDPANDRRFTLRIETSGGHTLRIDGDRLTIQTAHCPAIQWP
jgi:hypothetical protein